MVDFVEIVVEAGAGGDGIVSMRREKFVPKGGPDGGDGGDGGSVVLVASPALNTLLPFRYRRLLRAQRGRHGSGQEKQGGRGSDLHVEVPVGTVVRKCEDGDDTTTVELTRPGQALVVAWGGRGGRGNKRFATPTNQTPYLAEAGQAGERACVTLELKLVADVAIIGLPNAGKSTLLSVISAAHPRVAPYPFTTTEPVLGVASVGWRDMVVMEVPGLIEGAHAGRGLGDTFLRHAERARLFIHLLDGASPHAVDDYQVVNRELGLFKPELAEKPQVIAVNKMDLPEAASNFGAVLSALEAPGAAVYAVSAATGKGVPELLEGVATRLPAPAPQEPVDSQPVLMGRRPPERSPPVVSRDGDVFVVAAPRAERLIKRSDLRRWEGMAQFLREMRRLSVATALEQAGVQPGDLVRIGPVELEWA
ncbi:MAG: GTPase ObgE [Chloroflexi bacterium]|nr:GTPase ObgE [Chloroflexota bacterium]